MERITPPKDSIDATRLLFSLSEIPLFPVVPEKNFLSLRHPLWTENKARLIQEYIRLFTFITKHGTYIDGFSAPQRRELVDLCSAKLVLETEPKWVRNFWLCDKEPKGLTILGELAKSHQEKGRKINVVGGDFNNTIDEILASGNITEKTATFALLDQRTFECSWRTVEKLARHKNTNKIEIFYFFASGWLDRSIAAVKRDKTAEKLKSWWGRDDWQSLKGMDGIIRAKMVAQRFQKELGYTYSYPYAIHDKKRGGRTMYHMIHATDHPEAPQLMIRAYRKISGRTEIQDSQMDLESLWVELDAD